MAHPELVLIRSAQDVRLTSAEAAEPDCDCACPAEDLRLDQRQGPDSDTSADYELAAGLYTDSLGDGLSLAFNPRGRGGVVVMDTAARDLLAGFAQPRPLASLAPELRPAARRLAALDLVAPLGSPPRAIPDSATTLTAWLHVTNACNLRCPYCYLTKTAEGLELARGRQALEGIIRSALSHGFRAVKLKYAGGEASLNLPLVLALHAHAAELTARVGLGIRGVLLTNGVSLGVRAIAGLRAANISVAISLDGVGAAHDRQRPFAGGRGSFNHVQRTLDLLAEHGVTPSLTITLTAHNLATLPEVVDYALDRGLPFTLNFYRENDCGASHAGLGFSDNEAVAAIRAAFGRVGARLPRRSLLGALTDRARLDAPHGRACGAGHSYLVVDQRGGIATCQMQIERTVADIGAPDPLAIVRATSIGVRSPHVDQKPGCATCTWRYQCAGGCPAIAQRAAGSALARSPYCQLYRALFPDVLRLEARRVLAYAPR